MLKMSLEQAQIIGLEVSVIILTLLTHLYLLDEYIELWSSSIIGISIVIAVSLFQSFTARGSQLKPQINFNITL